MKDDIELDPSLIYLLKDDTFAGGYSVDAKNVGNALDKIILMMEEDGTPVPLVLVELKNYLRFKGNSLREVGNMKYWKTFANGETPVIFKPRDPLEEATLWLVRQGFESELTRTNDLITLKATKKKSSEEKNPDDFIIEKLNNLKELADEEKKLDYGDGFVAGLKLAHEARKEVEAARKVETIGIEHFNLAMECMRKYAREKEKEFSLNEIANLIERVQYNVDHGMTELDQYVDTFTDEKLVKRVNWVRLLRDHPDLVEDLRNK